MSARLAAVFIFSAAAGGCVSQTKFAYAPMHAPSLVAELDRQTEIAASVAKRNNVDPRFASDYAQLEDRYTFGKLAVCPKGGDGDLFRMPAIENDALCGDVYRSRQSLRICYPLDQIRSFGRPYKGRTFGYFPYTNEPVRCPS